MTFIIYSYLSASIDIILSWFLFKSMSNQLPDKKWKFLLVVIGTIEVLISACLKNTQFQNFSNLAIFIIVNYIVSLLFKVGMKKSLVYIGLLFLVSMFSETIVFYALKTLFHTNVEEDIFLLVGVFLTSILKGTFVTLTMRNEEKSNNNELDIPVGLFRSLLIVPFITSFILVTILYLDYYYVNFSRVWVLLSLMSILILNISIFVIFKSTYEFYSKYVKTLNTLNEIDLNVTKYNEMKKSIEKVRLVKHDLKNSMITIMGLLDSGDITNSKKFLAELVESTDKTNLDFYTKNEVLNYMLNCKIDIAKTHGIDVRQNILIPEKISMGNDVLSFILGNLLDNALNACIEMSEQANKFISIDMKVFKNNLLIEIENSFDPSLEGNVKTESNGLGLVSVQKVINKKQGIYEIKKMEKIYSVSVLLFNIM